MHVHRDGLIILANQQAANLFGRNQPSEIIGRRVMSLVDEASLKLARSRTAQLSTPGARNQPVEMIMRRLDSTTVVVEASSAAVLLDGERVVQAVLRDITERRRGEAALRESETRFRLAAAAVQGIVYDMDLLTGATWRSDGLERVLGISSAAVPRCGAGGKNAFIPRMRRAWPEIATCWPIPKSAISIASTECVTARTTGYTYMTEASSFATSIVRRCD